MPLNVPLETRDSDTSAGGRKADPILCDVFNVQEGKLCWSVALSHSSHRVRQQKMEASRTGKQSSFLAHCSGPCALKLFPPTRMFPGVPVSKQSSLPRSVAPPLITRAGPAQVKEHFLANKVVSNRWGAGGRGALRHWREQNTMEHR